MSKKANNGAFSTKHNIEQETKVANKYCNKHLEVKDGKKPKEQEFFHVKGEWPNQADYDEAGLPAYTNNNHKGYKNPCDLVRKNQIIDLKFSQSIYITLSEIVIASSQKAAACKIGQKADYIVEVINHDLTKSLRINVSKLMEHGDFVSGKDTKKVKLYLKRLIPGHFESGKGGKNAHVRIIKALKVLGVGTYGRLYRDWDL